MKRLIVAFVILLALVSCVSKYPTASIDFYTGVPMTCITDSTPLIFDTIVKLKMGEENQSKLYPKAPIYKHTICDNKPEYLDLMLFYPSQILLVFKEKKYVFLFSPRPAYPNVKYGEYGFGVDFKHDLGTINYSTKERTITLTSTTNNWTRTFKYSYNKRDKILTLTSKVVK